MTETVYSADPELAASRDFLRRAFADLRAAIPAGWRLFHADLRARRRQSLLGVASLLMPAAAVTLLCVYLQSRRIFDVGPTNLPYAAHVLAGLVLWQVFTDALNAPLQHLSASRQLLTRSRVPHEAIILAACLAVALNALIRLGALAAALVLLGIVPSLWVIAIPLPMIALAWLGLLLGLVVAPLGLLFGEMRHVLLLATGLWFFMTPILYPAPQAGGLRLNPVTPLLEAGRSTVTGWEAVPAFWVVSAISAAGLVLAWLFYRLARPHVVARLG